MKLDELKNQKDEYSKAVAEYLLKRIETDQCLKEKLESTDKTIKGCMNYATGEAKKQAVNGVACIKDDQVYEWVVHYILEDSINCEKGIPATEPKQPKAQSFKKKETAPKIVKPKKQSVEQLTLFEL